MLSATIVAKTEPLVDSVPTTESLIAYCARVSNPDNQDNHNTADRLMRYCAKHGHWSVFETVYVTIEIVAPRDITRQFIRHRSFDIQEFSQRYADTYASAHRELRMQDDTNRQSSHPINDPAWQIEWAQDQRDLLAQVDAMRLKWRNRGVAKEVVRVLMPEGLTLSRLYATGNLRDWHFYTRVRTGSGTQREHQALAQAILLALKVEFPTAMEALTNV